MLPLFCMLTAVAGVVHRTPGGGARVLEVDSNEVKSLNGHDMRVPGYLEGAAYYDLGTTLLAGDSLEMGGGGQPTVFYVVVYRCGGCSKGMEGGFGPQLLSGGWEVRGGGCAPSFKTATYDAHPMVVFKTTATDAVVFLNVTQPGPFVGVFSVSATEAVPCDPPSSRPSGPQQPAACLSSCVALKTTVTVDIPNLGSITGVRDTLDGSASYLGIPYAEEFTPFKQSTLMDTFPGGRLNATVYGEMCYQPGSPHVVDECHKDTDSGKSWGPAWGTLHVESSGRKCLNLNVFVPQQATAANPLPVMVFIPGGGFYAGGSNDEQLWHSFANRSILVIMNYRLGVQGFGYLNTMEESNFGLLDQRVALQWVRKNIASFNGTANKITLFGESAGGTSVAYHYTSPDSRVFFDQAILESAGIAQVNTKNWTISNTNLLASVIGFSEDIPQCPMDEEANWEWRQLPDLYQYSDCVTTKEVIPVGTANGTCEGNKSCSGYALIERTAVTDTVIFIYHPHTLFRSQIGGTEEGYNVTVKMMKEDVALGCLTYLGAGTLEEQALLVRYTTNIDVHPDTFYHNMWSPFPDGRNLNETIVKLIEQGEGSSLPVMIGTNLDEGTLFMPGTTYYVSNNLDQSGYDKWMADTFGATVGTEAQPLYMPDELSRPFPPGHSDFWVSAMRAGTDSQFACRAYQLLEKRLTNADSYFYIFSHTSQSDDTPSGSMYGYGSYHGLELEYLFHYDHSPTPNTASESSLMDQMSCYWQNFAATSNPNSPNGCRQEWASYFVAGTDRSIMTLQTSADPSSSTTDSKSVRYTHGPRCGVILGADPIMGP